MTVDDAHKSLPLGDLSTGDGKNSQGDVASGQPCGGDEMRASRCNLADDAKGNSAANRCKVLTCSSVDEPARVDREGSVNGRNRKRGDGIQNYTTEATTFD